MILKHKRVRHFKFRDQRTNTPRQIYLGTIDTSDGSALVVPDLNAPVDEIRAALELAEVAKREAAKRETKHLRGMFLDRLALEPEPGEK